MPPPTKLPRAVILLGWVSFFADVSGEMVYPLLPLFLVGVLGASAQSLGWVEGVATAVVALMTAWAGWRSDRLVRGMPRRVPWIRLGYGLPILGKALLAGAFAWPMVLAGRTVDRVGKGLRSSPRDALIADAVEKPDRGRAFGFHRAMDSAGAVLGVVLSAGLLWWLTGSPAGAPSNAPTHEAWAFRTVFAIAAALGLISWSFTLFLRENAPPPTAPSAPVATQPTRLSPAYWRTLALMLVFALANSSDAFLLLRAREVGLSPWAVVLAYALCTILYTLFSYPAGIISDRLGRWRVIAVGWTIYAAVYTGFAFTNSWGIWPLLAIYGIYLALTDGVSKALIADHAPKDRRGTAMGLFYMINGLVTLLASVIAGFAWDSWGPRAVFLIGAGFAAAAVLLIPLLKRR
ncbi:MAG: MFS transporter [Planctomycetes bacterium]|nr:MFS transporter [Planctomycetota bacterium]